VEQGFHVRVHLGDGIALAGGRVVDGGRGQMRRTASMSTSSSRTASGSVRSPITHSTPGCGSASLRTRQRTRASWAWRRAAISRPRLPVAPVTRIEGRLGELVGSVASGMLKTLWVQVDMKARRVW
jgi:hypothetical protein